MNLLSENCWNAQNVDVPKSYLVNDMSNDGAWIRSYKRRNVSYQRPDIPQDKILLDFHTKWFEGKFDEAAAILASHYSVNVPRVVIGPLPQNAHSSYDIESHVITISDNIVLTLERMVTFLESFFRHLASQRN